MTRALSKSHVAVIGLGYVGMPLALMLSKHMRVTGFDIEASHVSELQVGQDRNREIDEAVLMATECKFTSALDDIRDCDVYIVTVPTPVDEDNKPDLRIVESASKTVAGLLKKGDIVVYESTVYPGVTEDFCGPILAKGSKLVPGIDFFLGYSPERINPGDAEHTVQKITKVVAGQTEDVTDFLAQLYGSINGGNIFCAKDIRTAEAAKAIENAQRDINVAFINEVTMMLNGLGLSAHDVLEAAGTKWNFLKFTPGLVGGHCIGVDPYYLAECAFKIGYNPQIILAGRAINEGMGPFVADSLHNLTARDGKPKRILLMGFTFKENINDIRNTKVVDILKSLQARGHHVDVHDPHARPEDVRHEYGLEILTTLPAKGDYDALALLVPHKDYKGLKPLALRDLIRPDGVIYDMKGAWRSYAEDIGQFSRYHTL